MAMRAVRSIELTFARGAVLEFTPADIRIFGLMGITLTNRVIRFASFCRIEFQSISRR